MTGSQKAIMLPAPIAAALATGRPELARLGVRAILEQGYSPEQLVEQLGDLAEGMVADIQRERERVQKMGLAIGYALGNLKGSVKAVERLADALRLMRDGAPPDVIDEALRSKNTLQDR